MTAQYNKAAEHKIRLSAIQKASAKASDSKFKPAPTVKQAPSQPKP